MSIPGFTAEASLYKTSELYHAAIETDRASILTSGVVHPAQSSVLSSVGSIYIRDMVKPFFVCTLYVSTCQTELGGTIAGAIVGS